MAELLSVTILATLGLMLVLSAYLTIRFRRERQRDPAATCFARFCERLRRRNVSPIVPGETPMQYGRRAAATLPASASQIEEIVTTYLAARYEPDDDASELNRLRTLVNSFRPKNAPA